MSDLRGQRGAFSSNGGRGFRSGDGFQSVEERSSLVEKNAVMVLKGLVKDVEQFFGKAGPINNGWAEL